MHTRSTEVVGSSEPDPESRGMRGCTPEILMLYGEGVPILFPSHGLFGLVRGTWLSDGNRIFATFFAERERAGERENWRERTGERENWRERELERESWRERERTGERERERELERERAGERERERELERERKRTSY